MQSHTQHEYNHIILVPNMIKTTKIKYTKLNYI